MPAEVLSCPKGWGRVVFSERNRCPISGAPSCINCKAGSKTPQDEAEWKKLKVQESKTLPQPRL